MLIQKPNNVAICRHVDINLLYNKLEIIFGLALVSQNILILKGFYTFVN